MDCYLLKYMGAISLKSAWQVRQTVTTAFLTRAFVHCQSMQKTNVAKLGSSAFTIRAEEKKQTCLEIRTAPFVFKTNEEVVNFTVVR